MFQSSSCYHCFTLQPPSYNTFASTEMSLFISSLVPPLLLHHSQYGAGGLDLSPLTTVGLDFQVKQRPNNKGPFYFAKNLAYHYFLSSSFSEGQLSLVLARSTHAHLKSLPRMLVRLVLQVCACAASLLSATQPVHSCSHSLRRSFLPDNSRAVGGGDGPSHPWFDLPRKWEG